mmetsp:Transcript_24293/g.54038  ORF Transcript_24293/g.54038 Transcript_24293/m.54038 type:complete len:501 (-) Transcript_24293:120-1622(-)
MRVSTASGPHSGSAVSARMFDRSLWAMQGWASLREPIEAGLDVATKRCRMGRSLLHLATLALETDAVALLLEHGADPLLQDDSGITPLDMARGLRAALRAGGAGVVETPMAKRLDATAALVEYEAVVMNLLYEDLDNPAGSELGWREAPLFHLASDEGRARPDPSQSRLKPLPRQSQLFRFKTVEGAGQDRASHREAEATWLSSPEGHEVLDVCLQALGPLPARHSRQSPPGARCQICLESSSSGLIVGPCEVASCTGAFCTTCLGEHAKVSVGEMRYSVPQVLCPHPACRCRIPVRIWAPLIPKRSTCETDAMIRKAGQALMKVRCPNCHETRCLFLVPRESHASICEGLLGGLPFSDGFAIAAAAARFCRGGAAEPLVDALWRAKSNSDAKMPEHLLDRICGLNSILGDPERAVALLLAALHRYPFIQTPCCSCDFCFKCKIEGHHPGITCEERQAKEVSIEAQYCPSCAVPTVKSEGCSSIQCVCGRHWVWSLPAAS